MALRESLVPLLPGRLLPLYHYLLRRDAGAPTAGVSPLPIEQDDVGDLILDRITWEYRPGPGMDRRDPDGWVVWWLDGVTAEPTDGGVLLHGSARSYSMLWPADSFRSYAVAPFRVTYQGLEAGPKAQHPTWNGAA